MHPLLNIAVTAARAAGSVIVRYLDRVDTLDVATKYMNEFVTQVDREAEAIIIADIRKAYPHHAILAEESGAAGDSDRVHKGARFHTIGNRSEPCSVKFANTANGQCTTADTLDVGTTLS